jgi:hypothetical protein
MATISATQQPAGYTINFVVSSSSYPGTPTFVRIFKNGILFHTFTGTVGTAYSYTFDEPSSASVAYTLDGYANANAVDPNNRDQIASVLSFIVLEYKPTFTLPTITCVELNQSTSFYPTAWNQQENGICLVPPLTQQIKYERYEFDMNTSTYIKVATDQIIPIVSVPAAVATPSTYAYTWIPDKFAMVKIVVTVTNCSTSVQKATVFPVCGTWKIRRLACGNYRIYNYKNTNLIYSLSKGINPSTILKTATIPAFSYIDLTDKDLRGDGIYTINADLITQYIFNYCAIEECMLDLQKRILLDDSLCDECKLDKVLYQKALRLLPTYETWKKLLDKDWVYDMQYKSNDVDGELARIYDAQELYLELIKLCDECSTSTKGCGCGC